MLDPASPSDSEARRRSRTPRIILGLAVLLLLAIVAPPFVNINRFRRSIVQSISQGLGRPVTASAVELTLLPRPAFVLQQFAVEEDPAYGAEPVLMADTVTASLRASTLWHRRVEIATLHFEAPSVNLTRNAAGHWNFERLLHSSSRAELPRSTQPTSAAPLPFPYVEATQARVNFKLGVEKLPFSLEGADLAVWRESGSEWHLRVKARPVRTDLTVADAGQIRGDAVLLTAGPLEDAPIRMHLEWRRVELGEIGRMLQGEENNWRGMVDWTAQAQGTLASAQVSTEVRIAEVRRAEFVPTTEMDLEGRCLATYLRASNVLEGLQCSAPLGAGWLRVHGGSPLPIGGIPAIADPSVPKEAIATVALQHVPAQFLLGIFRHVHPGVNAEANITGELNGAADCRWTGIHLPHFCSGQIRSTALTLMLPQLRRPVQLSPLTMAASANPLRVSVKAATKGRVSRNPIRRRGAFSSPAVTKPVPGAWQLQPARIVLGAKGAGPTTTLSGSFTRHDLTLNVSGPANLRDLVGLSQALRIPALSGQVRASHGTAQLALTLKAAWLPQPTLSTSAGAPVMFTPSQWSGNVQIHNAALTIYALHGPVQLASGQVDLTPNAVVWSRLNGTYGHIPFSGSLRWQTPCAASTQECSRSFVLHVPNLNPATFIAALHQGSGASSLLEIVNPWSPGIPRLPPLQGLLDADILTLGKFSIRNAALRLQMAGHAAELLSLSGNVFGGTIAAGNPAGGDNPAAWPQMTTDSQTDGRHTAPDATAPVGSARWGSGAPVYTLHAALTRIQPDRVAKKLWQERWGSGVADTVFSLRTQGWSAAALAQHAQGRFSIRWTNGALAGNDPAAPAAKFQSWRASGQISDRKLVLRSSQITGWTIIPADAQPIAASASTASSDPVAPAQTVTGSISFGRVLDLHLEPSGILLTGPLESPTVATKEKPSGTTGNEP
jgi:hypothetical protein